MTEKDIEKLQKALEGEDFQKGFDIKDYSSGGDKGRLTVNGQYVETLKFSSPEAPMVHFDGRADEPNVDLNVDVSAATGGNDVYKVALDIKVHAGKDDSTVFDVHLVYAGVFTLTDVPEERIKPVIFMFCPTILFVYARRIISAVTGDGGFPMLSLDPIDFEKYYTESNK